MNEYVDLGSFDYPAEITGFLWPSYGQWLPVTSRMLVIYGRNGAGKSLTLDSIRAALQGQIDRVPVAINLRGHPYSLDTDYELGYKNDTYDAIWDYWAQAPRLGEANRMVPLEPDDPDLQPLALEVARAGLFILYPLGNGDFDVWTAADPAAQATAHWLQIYQSARELMLRTLEADGGPELVEAWQTGRWPQHVPMGRLEVLYEEQPAEFWAHPFLRAELGLPRPFLRLEGKLIEDDYANWWLADSSFVSPGPIPVAPVARARSIRDMTPAIRALGDSTSEGLHSRLSTAVAGIGTSVLKAEAQTWADRLSAEATSLCRQTLLDGPTLSVGQFGKPWTWAPGGALTWTATTDEDPRARPLHQLSEGERRWAGLAADLAMTQAWAWGEQMFPLKERAADYWARKATRRIERPVLILDEPESHLHRAAEAHMAAALSDLVGQKISLAIVATHSPHLLDLPGAQVLRVSRRALQPLQDGDREDLELLGLQPSDLLSITRVVLLVEGLHEELIFRESIGDELAQNGVQILPIRGATKLPQTLDSLVLFRFSSANIVAVVDNVDAGVVSEAWDRACQIAVTEGPESARKLLESQLPGGGASEHLFIRQWMFNGIQKGLGSRMTPWGLRKPDILDYLPVTTLVPAAGDASWEDLREQHSRALEKGSVPTQFKDWLVKVKGADLSPGRIREAARAMRRPEEFTLLVHECARAADDARRQTPT